MNKKILILATHFDDDIISFGGLISKSIRNNDQIWVHVFTCGGPASNVSGEIRSYEYKDVMEFMGVQKYTYSGIGLDGRLDTVPNCELTKMIDNMISEYKPDEVYCSAMSEHSDHQSLCRAFLGAARLKSGHQTKLFAFGTYMFSDQLYTTVDGGKIYQPLTEEDYVKKLEAFRLYKSQFKPSPSPLGEDGIRVMSEYHGMMCGHKYAELYYQLRYIRS